MEAKHAKHHADCSVVYKRMLCDSDYESNFSLISPKHEESVHSCCLLQKVLYLAVWPKEVLLCPEMMLHHFCFFFNARKVVLMYFVTM